GAQFWLFYAFALAFAIKVPLFPFHTWLPDAHVEAPTAGSVILAGVLLKMGTYGFLRFCLPLFPDAYQSAIPLISILALIGIIYGAMVAMVQKDVKSLVAYSSVSHLGFVMLGLFALNVQSVQGGILQMINHGISTGALFLLVGMIYERRHTRLIDDFGGVAKVMPVFAAFFLIVTLSSIGLPGTNGFIGEFLIILGAFKSNMVYAILAALGVILAAIYMLWMYQRVFFGKVDKPANEKLLDLNLREKSILVPLVILVFWIGLYPNPYLSKMEKSVISLFELAGQKSTALQNFPEGTVISETINVKQYSLK
ncbi:MAG TPA: NADH-quinone oxidoreductase subunit M, partial [candidate division Zixibacteria bacterium]|nr:NADH-quinone oxidoreductase subunit M [candidate division Zixibacteria bacterium]